MNATQDKAAEDAALEELKKHVQLGRTAGVLETTMLKLKYPDTPWLAMAEAEKAAGVKEYPGDADNPRIIEYHSTTSYGARDDEVSWCSSFVNWCLSEADIEGTDNAGARSWLHWGMPLKQPIKGCITVLWRKSPNSWEGHVAFYVGDHPQNNSYILLLGGNQGDSVCVAAYEKLRVLGFRWPT
jgi:uncharacterized protein (TIGR02594 family)